MLLEHVPYSNHLHIFLPRYACSAEVVCVVLFCQSPSVPASLYHAAKIQLLAATEKTNMCDIDMTDSRGVTLRR